MKIRCYVQCAAAAVFLGAASGQGEERVSLPGANPQTGERIKWQVIAAGGVVGMISTHYGVSGTVGQAGIGRGVSINYGCNSGFWQVFVPAGCCLDRVGDANSSGDDEPTIGDVSTMIDAKFITGTCDGVISCLAEADVNQSGGSSPTCDDITIGDISVLIDYLFITGPSLGLPDCF